MVASSSSDEKETEAMSHDQPSASTSGTGMGCETDEVVRTVKEAVSAAGFDSASSRVAVVLGVSGQVVDALFGDVFLLRDGLLAIVEVHGLKSDETSRLYDDVEQRWLFQQARVILVAFPQDVQSAPIVWIL